MKNKIEVKTIIFFFNFLFNYHFFLMCDEFYEGQKAFQSGKYSQAAELFEKSINNPKISFENKIIAKANLFISTYLSTEEHFQESEAYEILALIAGISNERTRNSVTALFAQNLSILCVTYEEYESAFKFLEIAMEVDETNRSDRMFDCYCLSFSNDRLSSHLTDFATLWASYLNKNYELVLQLVGNFKNEIFSSFLTATAHMGLGLYREALRDFEKSVSNSFRLTESLNGAGICAFKIGNIKESIHYFERAMKSSVTDCPDAIFNCAEVCGFLGRTEEQTALLQIFARLEYVTTHSGSVPTLYKLSRISLINSSFHEAVGQYQYVLQECQDTGMEVPSPDFFAEYAYALNMISDYKTAEEIFPIERVHNDFGKGVHAHSLFLAHQYNECEKLIANIDTPDSITNVGILNFIAGDERKALQILEGARRRFPKERDILRTIVLIKFSKPKTVKSGAMTWLTYLGYQLHHTKEFYEDIIQGMLLQGNADPVTIAALQYIASNANT